MSRRAAHKTVSFLTITGKSIKDELLLVAEIPPAAFKWQPYISVALIINKTQIKYDYKLWSRMEF